MNALSNLDGFDPLATSPDDSLLAAVVEDANKRVVQNILKSYTGYFDLFSELIQNALDAVNAKSRADSGGISR